MATTQTKYYAVGQGKVYIAPRDSTGIIGGFTHIGDCDGFQITTAQQFFDQQESMSGSRQTVVHVPTSTDYSLNLSVLNIDGTNLARALYGDTASVAGATVTGEAITAYAGTMAALKYIDVSAVTVKKGANTLVAGTDYELDAVNGTLTFLPGSTQVTGTSGVALTVDYTHGAISSKVQAFTKGLKDFALRFEGKTVVDGLAQVGIVYRCALDLAKTLDLIGTTSNKLALTGKLLPAAEITGAGESQYFTYIQK